MSKPEDELEFINVVDHGSTSQSASLVGDSGGGGGRGGGGGGGGHGGAGGGGGFAGGHLGFIRQSKNKVTAFFHYIFKFLALFFYVMGEYKFVSSSSILTYIICILMLAFDFWTVKNVSGRLMVGLRWWSSVKEDGTTEWMFESLEDMSEISSADYKLFWIGLYGTPVVWVLLFITGVMLLQFQWLVIVVIALLLSGANIYGYTKCNADAKNKVQQMVNDGMMAGAMQGAQAALGNVGLRNALFSMFGGDQQQQQGGGGGGGASSSANNV